jgi:glycine/D-amino acid oxidase-like deaminating enzyme
MQTRRDFVKWLSLATVGAAIPRGAWAAIPKLGRPPAPKQVVIVGAGLAGLVSAYLLKQAGHRVTILEARTRPGGRVLTAREGMADGLFGELGPARIPRPPTRASAPGRSTSSSSWSRSSRAPATGSTWSRGARSGTRRARRPTCPLTRWRSRRRSARSGRRR